MSSNLGFSSLGLNVVLDKTLNLMSILKLLSTKNGMNIKSRRKRTEFLTVKLKKNWAYLFKLGLSF